MIMPVSAIGSSTSFTRAVAPRPTSTFTSTVL